MTLVSMRVAAPAVRDPVAALLVVLDEQADAALPVAPRIVALGRPGADGATVAVDRFRVLGD